MIETDAKKGYWPRNRPLIKIHNFDQLETDPKKSSHLYWAIFPKL